MATNDTPQPVPKKRIRDRVRARAAEPSSWAGMSVLAGVALPGLLTYLQTGSKTAGIIAILSGLAGGAAVAMPEKGAAPK
jgi:predicted lipid-binding transport protein (Tim44 family)